MDTEYLYLIIKIVLWWCLILRLHKKHLTISFIPGSQMVQFLLSQCLGEHSQTTLKFCFSVREAQHFMSHRTGKLLKTLLSPTLLRDSNEIVSLITKCHHLKFKFRGVYAADLFPFLKSNCFIIENAPEFSKPESHWILLFYHDNNMYFADPMGLSVKNYRANYARLMKYYQHVKNSTQFFLYNKGTWNFVDSFVSILLMRFILTFSNYNCTWMITIRFILIRICCN